MKKSSPDLTLTALERSREEGSAYIITLMVLFILTVVGLSLTLITQTEMLVSSTERTAQRTFYAADSGINVQASKVAVYNDFQPRTYRVGNRLGFGAETVSTPGSGGGPSIETLASGIEDRVEVSQAIPIQLTPCNFCQINQDSEYFEINTLMTSTATRVSIGDDDVPMARKQITAMVELQPWSGDPEAFYLADEDAATAIKN